MAILPSAVRKVSSVSINKGQYVCQALVAQLKNDNLYNKFREMLIACPSAAGFHTYRKRGLLWPNVVVASCCLSTADQNFR